MSQSDRGATVRLTVETEAARNILVDAQPRLAAEARAQGVRLAGTEVDLGTAHQQGGDPRRNAEAQPQDTVRVVRARSNANDRNRAGREPVRPLRLKEEAMTDIVIEDAPQEAAAEPKKKKKGKKLLFLIILLLVIGGGAAGGYYAVYGGGAMPKPRPRIRTSRSWWCAKG